MGGRGEWITADEMADLVLGSRLKEPTPVGSHDLSGHDGFTDGPRGPVLADIEVGDRFVWRHDCGGADWTSQPFTVTGFRWSDAQQHHAVGLRTDSGEEGWTFASSLGLEPHGRGFTTVDTDPESPTYMTEIVHPMCGRWSKSNFIELIGGPRHG